ncbi:MAG: hypothetical protein EOS83_32425 [Mesorhizobium sp.]|nr:MAG: hypothetical protein EOS83_32425 [Mesorhizobium sp.]
MSRAASEKKVPKRDSHEFIRRFLLHTLPDGLHRIRRAAGCLVRSQHSLSLRFLEAVVSKHFTAERMCSGAGLILIDRCALAASQRQMTTI